MGGALRRLGSPGLEAVASAAYIDAMRSALWAIAGLMAWGRSRWR